MLRTLIVDVNGWTWETTPSVDDAERAVLAVASSEWDEDATADWLRPYLVPPGI